MTTDQYPSMHEPVSSVSAAAPPNGLHDSTSGHIPSNTQANSEQNVESEDARIELERAKAANAQALQDSREGIWFLKQISFDGVPKKIVTQNYNGPCSFIAICNILILRGDIEILPPDRTSVSYDILAQLVGEYLLRTSPDVDLSAALTMMPLTQKGMDLNPLFTSPTAFRPAGDGGALKLFEQAGIPLVHGWLVDPTTTEHSVLSVTEDYDNSVNLIVEADTLARGQLVVDENAAGPSSSVAGPSSLHGQSEGELSTEDRKKVEGALVVRNFLDSSSSQLTYHGLFTLASTIQPGSLVALFRNSHLSVLHRRASPSPSSSSSVDADSDPALYHLVTDYVFYNEPSVVWERLEDVDGGASTFVDADFRRSSPVGGDFAGVVANAVDPGAYAEFDPADQELARRLQAEEDAHAQEVYARREQQRQQQHQQQRRQPQYDPRDPRYAHYVQQQQYAQQDPRYAQQGSPVPGQMPGNGVPYQGPPPKMKRKTSCIIM